MPLHDWSRVEAGIYHAFHTTWISEIQNNLNRGLLPSTYYALAEQHSGHYIADVLALHTPPDPQELESKLPPPPEPSGGIAMAEAPPQVSSKETIELETRQVQRSLTVRHISTHRIVALLEIVSPGNKDRAEHVEAFAVKTATSLEQGVHVLVIDPFRAGKHDPQGIDLEIRRRLVPSILEYETKPQPPNLISYAIGSALDIYTEHVELRQALPEMPLFLQRYRYVNVPLEATYPAAWEGMPKFWQEVLLEDSN